MDKFKRNNYYPFGLEHKGYNSVINGQHYPYGFGGKEENDELGIEWLDFWARNYDASLGRWMNLDPLAELMRRHSPYNYAFDNPLRYIDPDGMAPNDVIVEGNEEFRQKTLEDLQSLTDDVLEMDKNGKVTVVDSGCNSGCEKGTDVVSELIYSDKVTTIVESTERNTTDASNKENTSNGVGSDAKVNYNPNLEEGGVNVDGDKERPAKIGLAHELGHAKDIINGTEPTGQSDYVEPFEDLKPSEQFEPNSYNYNLIRTVSNSEIKVRKTIENPIRKEQNEKARKLVKRSKFKYDKKY